MKAILFIAHGSRNERANEEVKQLAQSLRGAAGVSFIQAAFLEIAEPSVTDGIEACVKKGCKEILIMQHFLNSGEHVSRDIPYLVEKARRHHRGIAFRLLPPLGAHSGLKGIYLSMMDKRGAQTSDSAPRSASAPAGSPRRKRFFRPRRPRGAPVPPQGNTP